MLLKNLDPSCVNIYSLSYLFIVLGLCSLILSYDLIKIVMHTFSNQKQIKEREGVCYTLFLIIENVCSQVIVLI